MMRVAVFGATGQLGSDLVDTLSKYDSIEVFPVSHDEVDCTDAAAVEILVRRVQPQCVVNCAAFVRVDDCEEQLEVAFQVNAGAAFNIAKACAAVRARCVYISTDYVFDGAKPTPYVESDATAPINVYGTSKLAGEWLVRQSSPDWLIVRVASLFGKTGARGKGGNFIETILARAKSGGPLRVVNDISISPTYTRDAASMIQWLIRRGMTGVIHAANRGRCTWYEFATTAIDLCGLDATVEAVSASNYPTRARRPLNSVLESEQFPPLARRMPTWQDALRRYLIEKGHISQ